MPYTPSHFSRRPLLPLAAFALASVFSPLVAWTADEDIAAPKENRLRFIPQISVIDKFVGAEMNLGPALGLTTRAGWDVQYKELYGKFQENVDAQAFGKRRALIAFALGIKISDGVLALQSRDKEALNACADAILNLATKLGVPPATLQRSQLVKQQALQNHWLEAFMQLGRLQQTVLSDLERDPDRKDDALLVTLGGWLQGGRAITSLVLKKYSDPVSNILREPKFVELMIGELDNLQKAYKEDPAVQALIKFMPEIKKRVSVGLRDPIPQADVEWMHAEFTRLVGVILRNDAAAPTTPPAK